MFFLYEYCLYSKGDAVMYIHFMREAPCGKFDTEVSGCIQMAFRLVAKMILLGFAALNPTYGGANN